MHGSGVHAGLGSFVPFIEGWLQAQAVQMSAWSPSLLQAHPLIPRLRISHPVTSAPCAHAVGTGTSVGPRFLEIRPLLVPRIY